MHWPSTVGSKATPHRGLLTTGVFVGSISIEIVSPATTATVFTVSLPVTAVSSTVTVNPVATPFFITVNVYDAPDAAIPGAVVTSTNRFLSVPAVAQIIDQSL